MAMMEVEMEKLWQIIADRGLAYAIASGGAVLGFRWAWMKLGKMEEQKAAPEGAGLCAECPHRHADDRRLEASELRSHRFFGYMRHASSVVIPALPIREAGRQALAIDFLGLKFSAAAEALREFVERPDLDELSSTELADQLLEVIDGIIQTYEMQAIRLATRKNGVPAMMVFMGRFREVHSRSVEEARDHIMATCTSGWLGEDPVAKTAAVLDYMVSVFRRTLADAERTLGRLNGQLSGLMYDGITIGPCPDSIGYGAGVITAPLDMTQKWAGVEQRIKGGKS